MTGETADSKLLDFESIYLRLRLQEGRLYTDQELEKLPVINRQHPYYSEWMIRRRSTKKLVQYIERNKNGSDILEIGCGNGWLTRQLASVTGARVIGVDINYMELQQAARVFHHIPNLHFIYTDIRNEPFREKKFDLAVFAASIQYFEMLPEILDKVLKLLKPGGEIHILDSPFYSPTEIQAAKQRSRVYYEQAGFPAMTSCYFHHSLNELHDYHPEILFDPNNWISQLQLSKNPFHWIRIRK